jgi:hypothetical protein
MKKGMLSLTFFGNAAKKCPISCIQNGERLSGVNSITKKRGYM